MHDDANEQRTKLKLAGEQVEKDQEMTDYRLQAEVEKVEMEHKLKMDQEEHRQKLELKEFEHKLAMEAEEHGNSLQQKVSERQSQLQARRQMEDQFVTYLRHLKVLGTDLTEYLCSKNPKPNKVTRILTASGKADVHLHSS
jgi:uncharacterized protein YndB with AHSA1/START domain